MRHLVCLARPLDLQLPAASFAAESKVWALDPESLGDRASSINHLKFSPTCRASSRASKGTFTLDEAKPEASTFDVHVAERQHLPPACPKRDDHLKSPDFFNVKQFATKSRLKSEVG